MKKFLIGLVLSVIICVPAFASVNVHENGVYKGPVTDINVVGDSLSVVGRKATITNVPLAVFSVTGDATVGGVMKAATASITGDTTIGAAPTRAYATAEGDLAVAGSIQADGAIYSLSSLANRFTGLIYDSAIYGAAAGTGAGKQVWISADGKIYAP